MAEAALLRRRSLFQAELRPGTFKLRSSERGVSYLRPSSPHPRSDLAILTVSQESNLPQSGDDRRVSSGVTECGFVFHVANTSYPAHGCMSGDRLRQHNGCLAVLFARLDIAVELDDRPGITSI